MRIPEVNTDQAIADVSAKNVRVDFVPNTEEIKLAARAFASMPFDIFA